MTAISIALITVIIVSITLYIVALRKGIKEGFTGKQIVRFVLPLGILFIVYLSYNLGKIEPADWAQILLMLGLVIVTGLLAFSAAQQSRASVKMAEEMKKQRYDAVRPVIDIQRKADTNTQTREAFAAESKETSYGLNCVLRNIGLGPALDICSFIQTPNGERRRWEFGTLPTEGETERERFSLLESNNNQWELVAYYRDVYGRAFKSSREISIDEFDKYKWNVGPLRICLIKEEELP